MGINDLLDRVRATDTDGTAPDVPNDLSGLDTDEASDLLPPDPKPGKRTARSRAPRPSSSPKASAGQKKQVEDALVLLMSVIGGGISMRDQVCGPAISANASQVAKAAVPIICRNPAMLAWFTGGAGFMDFFALLVALQPVVGTAWSHHVTKSVEHTHDEGVARVDYSAYAAPSI